MTPPAPTTDPALVIALGASAGGVEALSRVVAGLPADLPAAVLVVLHMSPSGMSVLPEILARAGRLPAVAPRAPVPLEAARIYVAPPDHHLVVEDGLVRPTTGPRENGHRPAVDPTFRSIADAYGPRAVGVVLSGTRDDGSAGLGRIKQCGGWALVQDPAESLHDGMPLSAMQNVAVDAVLDTAGLVARLRELAGRPGDRSPESAATGVSAGDTPTRFTCPDCGGVLLDHVEGGVPQFVCSVGHAYSPLSLDAEHAVTIERSLWAAARVLDDRAALMDDMSRRAETAGHRHNAALYAQRARDAEGDARNLRGLVEQVTASTSALPGTTEEPAR